MNTIDYRLSELWNITLKGVLESSQIRQEDFDSYFTDTYLASLEDTTALVVVPSFATYVLITQIKQLIEFSLEMQIGRHVDVTFIQEKNYIAKFKLDNNADSSFLQTEPVAEQTFDNFVVGRSNSQAHVAATTCARSLGMIYNPLFIYGNTGLGKTHLLNAIGNQVKALDPSKKIGYISSENFVEGVYQSVKNKKIDEFKQQFHDLDLLLVDDIQFIAGKNKTHEIFFSIFNDLISNRKQVCITADKSPNDIDGLEERIISRFNQGLNVNIESPEYETSLSIIKMKIANNISFSQDIDDEVLTYIATNCSQNVRTIEGALKRLLFYYINFSDDNRITLKVAVEALKDQVANYDSDDYSITKIKKTVSNYYGITPQQLISKNRTRNITNARHIAMYLCRKMLDASYKEIGKEFGKRDHSTVMNACVKVEKNIKTNPLYQKVVEDIETKVKINPQ